MEATGIELQSLQNQTELPVKTNDRSLSLWDKTKNFTKLLFRAKNINSLINASKSDDFKRSLNGWQLIFFGIGSIVGTGIFVYTGQVAANYAGPSVTISFIISGIAASLSALSYSELASMIPVAGSAYTYTYATMGELPAWIIGWDLILEYLAGTSAVAVGWSGYILAFFQDAFGITFSKNFTGSAVIWNEKTLSFLTTDSYINVPAMVIVILVTIILTIGTRESAMLNSVVVSIKVTVILIFIFASIAFINPSNWTPFVPPADPDGVYGHYGLSGVFKGASVVFFAYIGFDSVSTAAQESKNPKRDMPIGIIGSLVICTILYIAVSIVLTGLVPYKELNVPHPISVGIQATGIKWLSAIIDLGAVLGLTSVMMISLLSQARIFYSMSKDGLLPPLFSKVHKRFGTPWISQIILGVICAIFAGIFPTDLLGELTSVGTLFAFLLTNIGVLILRIRHPEIPRKFKVPFGPYLIPISGALISLLLIATSSSTTILRLSIWLVIGIIIYFLYGMRKSRLSINKN